MIRLYRLFNRRHRRLHRSNRLRRRQEQLSNPAKKCCVESPPNVSAATPMSCDWLLPRAVIWCRHKPPTASLQ
eukprot:CAMPEP_0194270454 /NCGR_PEP_ID=MMETSP0169-20130528/4434_1 /TAXON_ID=218684 /ORGANISM="Corethron pennatum, Strain L29A3" /LENGTH=72 /DNA_ID=CAMNT_0039012505 /DNA_START=15 /DNA_END=230 /DNA_ORIENTATION=+